MYTVDDIDVFIMTHNRARYLYESIRCLLNQTVKINSITVFDNESTDNTEEVVKSFENEGVKYIKTFGFLGNYNKAKEIASRKYCMLFHDDDILHPQYIDLVLKLLNKYKDVSMITTRFTEFFDDDVPAFVPKLSQKHFVFEKQSDFAQHMYIVEYIAYATTIYRTADFKKIPLEYEKFNKFNDWPLMVKVAGCGTSILLDDNKVFYVRRHSGQDTWTPTNCPTLEQIVNWDKFFFDKIKLSNDFSVLQIVFNYKCASHMKGKYNNFLSENDKKQNSILDLEREAKRQNLYPLLSQKWVVKKVFKAYRTYLKRKCLRQKID